MADLQLMVEFRLVYHEVGYDSHVPGDREVFEAVCNYFKEGASIYTAIYKCI